jgi:hypothetical protein
MTIAMVSLEIMYMNSSAGKNQVSGQLDSLAMVSWLVIIQVGYILKDHKHEIRILGIWV